MTADREMNAIIDIANNRRKKIWSLAINRRKISK